MPPLHLYTAATMNGWKPLIFLEEAALDYELTAVDFAKKEQKAEAYLQLNPNGRIPTLVDREADNFVVFESGAILWYLAQKYRQFLPTDSKRQSQTLQWIMFQMSGVGPMMGQAMYFQRIAAPKGHTDEFAIQRYVEESRRLLEVLNTRLSEHRYIVGEEYTIADMAMYPYARSHYWARVSIKGLHHLQRWLDTLDQRPAIQKALTLPHPFPAFFGEGDTDSGESENAAKF